MVKRVYSEKKEQYAVRARELKSEIRDYLGIKGIEGVRVLVRYDVENISDETYQKALGTIFSEPPVDFIYEENFPVSDKEFYFSVEYLPGQFDQRADSAVQAVRLLNETEEPVIKCAVTYVLKGNVTDAEKEKIEKFCINPVDQRIADEVIPATLDLSYSVPADIKTLENFITMPEKELKTLYESLNLAMTFEDFEFIRDYFKNTEHRNPTFTEIRVFDTYWSDHCRHTTFLTELQNVEFEDGKYSAPIRESFKKYVSARENLYKNRPDKYMSLMDLATIGMKELKAKGYLDDLEESDEINACSIVVPIDVDGKTEEWLIFFKNETHNHPTEIEPFGGAATCLGGAIRDPLSGRGYVYQAMRVTGAADPRKSLAETLPGKLPQRKIVTGAANGYSSYGNQIGLATGLVDEIYHPNYVAKRLEIGAVMGAAKRENVIREDSLPGDVIILIGGRTGRDGCGGATGSSKAHNLNSINTCGAEVQKGNAPTERKLQRLFRRPEVTKIIKKCNDFGAGGVSVAIGELADGIEVNLDLVPKKYAGLDGTELAISESQERMAVVVEKKDADKMLEFSASENLEAVVVARVTEEKRLVFKWRGKDIVNISRDFLNTNGAHLTNDVYVECPEKLWNEESFNGDKNVCDNQKTENDGADIKDKWLKTLSDLNVCSKKGLSEMFDSSIGAGSVLMPYGGKYQLTPTQVMAAKVPVLNGNTDAATMMSYGFDPYISSVSPYHGAVYACISSVSKIAAAGGDISKIRFTFQEFFERLYGDKKRFGKPFAALLGAYAAQTGLHMPSIGGKDSMSGSFNDIDVPPTLVSFAVNVEKADKIISDEFKSVGNKLILFTMKRDEYELPDYADFLKQMGIFKALCDKKLILSAYAVSHGGISEAVSKAAFGNGVGAEIFDNVSDTEMFTEGYGNLLAEIEVSAEEELRNAGFEFKVIGKVTEKDFIYNGVKIDGNEALKAWTRTLESVFKTRSESEEGDSETQGNNSEVQNGNSVSVGASNYPANIPLFDAKNIYPHGIKKAVPRVFIPVFPGTNCEYDLGRAFKKAGASVTSIVFKNRDASDIKETVEAYKNAIKNSEILMFPGGFSAGDEPDGSGKFIAAAFRNPFISDAVNDLIKTRDGLVLGICNGFQALVKLGLLPYGEICDIKPDSPTLTRNRIGRHISKIVYTRVTSNKSPWLMNAELGRTYAIPASHGEGRFVANEEWLKRLTENGQIATQYVDLNGNPTYDEDFNPNMSYMAIEGITDKTGRIFGKMAHSERIGSDIAKNVPGVQDQKIFESGVKYFL